MCAELRRLHERLRLTTLLRHARPGRGPVDVGPHRRDADGRFVEVGTPEELYYRPRAAFTARLIGGANVLQGTASGGDAGLTMVETPVGRLLSVDKAAGPVQVFVRPDKIAPASEPGVNVLDCRVRERRFAGETTELDLVHGDDAQILRCRVPTTLAVAVGQAFRVHIDPSDVRTFRCD